MNSMSQAKFQKNQAPLRQKGAGMMEVLIALFVLSIGILGLATLQSIGLKYNHQSYQRTQAILQIYDMADRIRSNSTGKALNYAGFVPAVGPATLPIDCTVVICDGAQRAAFDIERWRQSLANFLGPDAEGGVDVSTVAGSRIHSITVNWMENDVQMGFTYEAQL